MEGTWIEIGVTVNADLEKVWNAWTTPEHIMNWNFASDDWHCPAARNDLRKGGSFSSTMASKDGKMSFEFGGVYSEVKPMQLIQYALEDGRKVEVWFNETPDGVELKESFQAEGSNSDEMQKAGWQAILGNFRKYTESL